jgi:hypothetical protein
MKEIIVTYNAEQLGYNPDTVGGLEDALLLFEHDPKPESAMYVANTRFGVELGAIIATYKTDDPTALLEKVKEAYGTAISYVEEGGVMEAYTEREASSESPSEESSE